MSSWVKLFSWYLTALLRLYQLSFIKITREEKGWGRYNNNIICNYFYLVWTKFILCIRRHCFESLIPLPSYDFIYSQAAERWSLSNFEVTYGYMYIFLLFPYFFCMLIWLYINYYLFAKACCCGIVLRQITICALKFNLTTLRGPVFVCSC